MRWKQLGVLAFAAVTSAASAGGQGSLFGLGDIPGGTFSSQAWDVSADGGVIVGHSMTSEGARAFRWTPLGGMQSLGTLGNGSEGSFAFGVSADGTKVVGRSQSGSGLQAFKWSMTSQVDGSGSMLGLGDFSGGPFASSANDITANGNTIVGWGSVNTWGYQSMRWNQGSGMSSLGHLPGSGLYSSYAMRISDDGVWTVGQGTTNSGNSNLPFRYSQATGMQSLGDLPGGANEGAAWGVNANGTVAVGWSRSGSGMEAFRWQQGVGMVGLGDLSGGGFESRANFVSNDGLTVLGYGTTSRGQEAFIWKQGGGMQKLETYLHKFGLDPAKQGWILRQATSISLDGRTIVGFGTNSFGQQEAFVATVPEPTTMAALGLGALALWRGRRRIR